MRVSFDTSSSRHSLLSLSTMAAVSALAGCVSTPGTGRMVGRQSTPLQEPIGSVHIAPAPTDAELAVMYGPTEDGGFLIPAVPYKQIDPRYYLQQVLDPTGEAPGTIVVDTPSRFLCLVQPGGSAMRYGVGIGRDGFAWQGNGIIQWRQKWPRWKPPNEMVARQPELAKFDRKWRHGAGPEKSAGCASAVHLLRWPRHTLSSARQSAMALDWQGSFFRICAPAQPGHYRPL